MMDLWNLKMNMYIRQVCLLQSAVIGVQSIQTAMETKQSCSCLRRLWLCFDNGLLRVLRLGWGCFYRLGLDVDVLCLARGTCLCLAVVQAQFLDLQLQPRTLFPLLLLPLMSALHLSSLVLLRLLEIRKRTANIFFFL